MEDFSKSLQEQIKKLRDERTANIGEVERLRSFLRDKEASMMQLQRDADNEKYKR